MHAYKHIHRNVEDKKLKHNKSWHIQKTVKSTYKYTKALSRIQAINEGKSHISPILIISTKMIYNTI